MWKKLFLPTFLLLIFFSFSYAQSIKLQDYKPKNQDEVAIIQVLKTYLEGWQNRDKQKILTCCSDNIELMDYRGKYLTKKQLTETNVDDWDRQQWFGLYDPKIMIDGNKASVNIGVARGKSYIELTLQMLRENQQWLILKHQYHF
jgi:hypothetical protein